MRWIHLFRFSTIFYYLVVRCSIMLDSRLIVIQSYYLLGKVTIDIGITFDKQVVATYKKWTLESDHIHKMRSGKINTFNHLLWLSLITEEDKCFVIMVYGKITAHYISLWCDEHSNQWLKGYIYIYDLLTWVENLRFPYPVVIFIIYLLTPKINVHV